jgi:hypothetical protein
MTSTPPTSRTSARSRAAAAGFAAAAAAVSFGLATFAGLASAAPAAAVLTGPTVHEQQALNQNIAIATNAAFPAAVAPAVSAAVSAGPVVSAQAAPAKLPVVTTFTRNHFPESLAIDGQGNLYASLDYIGQVVKVTPSGQQQLVASFDVGAGFLTGLAFDRSGNLYVADATFEASPTPPGVFRISAGGAVTRVATLPTFSFPNGLAFHDGSLYITDSCHQGERRPSG